ncbi:hypothetical protein VST7929_02781 [Vibrio stylophorae]|uniref:Uncharacterized protein n=1 Tax=Vibrio stylophorae TaxID=659351 RepID=A0ABN8DUX8_9VIBR|nr:hypothetical protein [Vibrio stylophorae]CAH0535120.1 hypothetical protein VST7929_02781 [Vibrio stylophorae]
MNNNFKLIILVVFIVTVILGLVSSIHVPYLRSNLITFVSYGVILPISIIPLFVVSRGFLNPKVRRSKFLFSALKLKATFSLIGAIFMITFSLYVMAWPTYWFASQKVKHEFSIVGVDTRGSKGYIYELRITDRKHHDAYDIPISKTLYLHYLNQCHGAKIPITVQSWWAGSVIHRQDVQNAFQAYCL